jgi:hypothetical protein
MKKTRLGVLRSILIITLFLTHACPALAGDFNYDLLQNFLDRHLTADQKARGFHMGLLDYRAISKENSSPDSNYQQLLAQFSAFDPARLHSRDEKLAFWINAYNLGAIKMVIDHFPVNSIRSRKINFLKNPWNIKVLAIGGKSYSLGQIEHDILLDELAEPMAHFAIVCASFSCPDLSPTVYLAEDLKKQLAKQASLFLHDPKKGLNINRQQKTVYFSQIFKFDKKTFPDGARSALKLISPFLSKRERIYLLSESYKIKYLEYDWDLNIMEKTD